jgi:hypothetical protein
VSLPLARAVSRPALKLTCGVQEFPSLCETCLGSNPYLRMVRICYSVTPLTNAERDWDQTKQGYGSECKICTRPFTVFRWMPGAGMRFKKTEVCQTCAKLKNCCQTCLLDLQYGLPVAVRDAALHRKDLAPSSEINREYFAQNAEASGQVCSYLPVADGQWLTGLDKLSVGRDDCIFLWQGRLGGQRHSEAACASGSQLQTQSVCFSLLFRSPMHSSDLEIRPHLCSFYAKGSCGRGDECPYRHELPVQNDMSKQNLQDRYYGRNDPVARKILAGHAATVGLEPPEDTSIVLVYMLCFLSTETQLTLSSQYRRRLFSCLHFPSLLQKRRSVPSSRRHPSNLSSSSRRQGVRLSTLSTALAPKKARERVRWASNWTGRMSRCNGADRVPTRSRLRILYQGQGRRRAQRRQRRCE